jgi:hypothetical protein
VLDFALRPVVDVDLLKKVFTSRARCRRVKHFRKYVLYFEAPSASQPCNL